MRRVPVTVESHLTLSRADLASARVSPRAVRAAFEYDNPDFWKKQRMGFYTGDTPRTISLVEVDGDRLRLPRGVTGRLLDVLAAEGVGVRFADETVSGTGNLLSTVGALEYVPAFALNPDQLEAAFACLKRKSGIIIGPCGSGKTEVALKAIAEIGERAIVVVHTERILRSWLEKAEARFPRATVGAFYGKAKRPDADIVVGMVQTVRNKLKVDPGWVRGFGTFVMDEAHHASAKSFQEVTSHFPAKWRIAFTATPKRKDGKEALFFDAFGSVAAASPRTGKPSPKPRVLHRITDEDLDRYGRITPVEVVVVQTDFSFDLNLIDFMAAEGIATEPGESTTAAVKRWARTTNFKGSLNPYTELLDAMTADEARRDRILSYLLPEVRAGEVCLLLADRRDLCLDLRAWLRRNEIECGALMGGKNRREADKTEDAINAGTLRVAVGTTVADEGMDVGPLSRGFGCTPTGSNPGRLTQQFGRLKRLSPATGKKDARFFYFWDRNVTGLRRHLRAVFNLVRPPHTVWWSETPRERVPLTRELVAKLER
jgi:superfamily II DNA or RNA helicase